MGKKALQVNNPPDEHVLAKQQKRKRLRQEKKKRRHEKLQDPSVTSTVEAEENAFTCPAKPEYVASSKAGKSEGTSVYSTMWQQYMPAQTTLIKGADWYSQRATEKQAPKVLLDLPIRQKLKDLAAEIYKTELEQFEKAEENSGSREVRFRRQILRHGAAKDRVAAHVLRLSEAPLHSMQHFASVVSLLSSNKDSLIKDVSKSLEDVLGSALLPRCLVAKPFEQHDFQTVLPNLIRKNIRKAETQLLIWYFEDQLRLQYMELLKALQEILKNSNEGTKLKAVQFLLRLIGNHPQQETDFIIQMLINKLGDLEKPVAIAVVYGVRNLLNRRPALKSLVVDTSAEFLYRANQRGNTYLNCMLLLKDVLYTKNDGALAQKMVKLYFGFFKACIKKGEVDGKLMSVILRGLNRVLPFLTGQQGPAGADFLLDQMDTLYRMAHLVTNFSITVQLMQLLYQVQAAVLPEGPLTERFHRVLYSQLLSPDFGKSSCVAPFLNIVFKTMNRMDNMHTLKAFAKRLLQVTAYQPTQVSIALLFILSEVCVDNPLLVAVMNGLSELPKEEPSEDDKLDYKDLLDLEPESVVDPLAQRATGDDDDEEEYFEDLDVGPDGKPVQARGGQTSGLLTHVALGEGGKGDEAPADASTTDKKQQEEKKSAVSWLHRANQRDVCKQEVRATKYDPHHRNPTYCGVQHAPIWELRNAIFHFHPSMAAFTNQLMNHEPFNYKGDPLIDFSFMKFLERFIYKNPKKAVADKGSAGSRALGAKSQYTGQGVRSVNVATEYFRKLKEESVPEDIKFFHKYFATYKNIKSKKRKQKKTGDDESLADEDEIDDDEFDEYLQTLGDVKKYKDDDEFDDEWDFAAKAKKSTNEHDSDSEGDDEFPEDDDDDDDDDGEDDLDMEDVNGQEDDDDDESLGGSDDDMGPDDDDMEQDDEDDEDISNYFDDEEEDSDEDIASSKKDLKKTKANSKTSQKTTLDGVRKKKKNNLKSEIKKGDKISKDTTSSKKKKKQREAMEESLEGEGEDSDWASLSGGDSDDGGIDFNEEDVSFSDDDDDYSLQQSSKSKKRKNDGFMDLTAGPPSRKRARGPRSLESMLMDADEFSAMLQQNESRPPAVTSDHFVNTGKTSMKQLKWEEAQAAGQLNRKKKVIPEKFAGKNKAKAGSKSKKKWRK